MALGVLFILFIVMSVVSILGLLFMFMTKNEQIKKKLFYFMAVWGMLISVVGAVSQPSNFLADRIMFWVFGFISLAGLLVHIKAVSKTQYMVAYVFITVSVICSILKLYIF